MSISLVYYSNTFADWVTTTNLVVNRVNYFDTGNFVKSSGTLSINVPSAYTSTLDISGRTTYTSNVSFTAGNVQFSNTANVIFSVNTFFNRELTSNNVVKLNNVYANGNIWFGNSSVINISSNTLIANLNSELLDGRNSSYYIELSNTGIVQAQTAFGRANSAYNQANTGTTQAQAAYNQANSAYNQANSFSTVIAQAAFSQANSAYNQANTGTTQAQSAFAAANNEPIAKSAFGQANLAFGQANTGTTQAQAAFGRANTANTNAANASFLSTGTVATARLGSGTANTTTYLRGDNSWATVTGGATLSDDVDSTTPLYIGLSASSSGAWTSAIVSTSKLYFTPNTGTLSATIFNSLSDITLKENFEEIKNPIEIINKINPIGFDWKGSGKKSYGVIAQELEKILPELVSENNGIKSVEYNSLLAFLIGAVKEMSDRLDKLENK